MKSILIMLFFTASLSWNNLSDNDVDYKPGLLYRELRNLSGNEVHQLREILISDSLSGNNIMNGKFFEVVSKEKIISTVYIGRVTCCRAGGCSNPMTAGSEAGFEYFDYFMVFDLQGMIISVRVYNYAATHGQEITARGWLKQFMGFDGKRMLRIGKEIDSISGATVSVNGIVADVQEKTAILNSINKPN